VGPQGFGNGPGVPPANVPSPNPSAGVGDHPFGGTPTVKGIFNMPTATQYKLEVADNPGGPYSEIAVPVDGRNYIPTFPFVVGVIRNPSGLPDPGWYNVAEIADSDGGPNAIGEKRLLDWPTGMLSDGIYYLRLRAATARANASRARGGVIAVVAPPEQIPTRGRRFGDSRRAGHLPRRQRLVQVRALRTGTSIAVGRRSIASAADAARVRGRTAGAQRGRDPRHARPRGRDPRHARPRGRDRHTPPSRSRRAARASRER
jgi:hypothetical protein